MVCNNTLLSNLLGSAINTPSIVFMLLYVGTVSRYLIGKELTDINWKGKIKHTVIGR